MRYIGITLCLIVISSSVFAHRDRIIALKSNGQLEGLPVEFMPACFHKEEMALSIKGTTLRFPACVKRYFPTSIDYKLLITSSWYHDKSLLLPYLNIQITPANRDYQYRLLFSLDGLKPISFTVDTKENESIMLSHTLQIEESCMKEIMSSTSDAK